MNCYRGIVRLAKIFNFYFWLFIVSNINLFAKVNDLELTVYIDQSEVLSFQHPVKRVAIANPEIADATVISSNQILVIGKSVGITSMIVWSETGEYLRYKLKVQNESSSHQIMLKVRFMEVNKSALKEFGSDFIDKNFKVSNQRVDVGSFGGKVGKPSDPLELGNTVDLFFAIPTQNLSAIFKALQENNLLSILATPNLSAISGSEASFLAGGEFPIPIVSGSMGMQTVTIQFKEFGVKLKFVPTVLDSNLINIKVAAEVSNLDFENGITLSGFQIPSLVTRKAETTVELEEGQYLIIGGLLSNEITKTVSKIPVLGHIPVLGLLFSSKRYLNKESELLITLSPQIVHSIREEEVPELNMNDKKKGGE